MAKPPVDKITFNDEVYYIYSSLYVYSYIHNNNRYIRIYNTL